MATIIAILLIWLLIALFDDYVLVPKYDVSITGFVSDVLTNEDPNYDNQDIDPFKSE